MSDNSYIKNSGPEIVHRTTADVSTGSGQDRQFQTARTIGSGEEKSVRSVPAAAQEMASRYVDPTTGAVDVPAAAKAFGTTEETMKEIVAPRLGPDSPEAKRAATQAIAAVFSPDEWTAYQVWGSTGPEELVKMHVAVWQEAYTNEERAKELSVSERQRWLSATGGMKPPVNQPADGQGFRSRMEMAAAMNDPRYGRDVAYTRAIEDEVGRSKFA